MGKILKDSCGLPIIMCKGEANTPQRFWDYRLAFNPIGRDELIKEGFVVSIADKQIDKDGKINVPDNLFNEWWSWKKKQISPLRII